LCRKVRVGVLVFQHPAKAALGKQVELDVLLPNHEAACKIIQDNIHLAADATLVKIMLKYIKHVTIYRAIRATGDKETDPIDVGEPWPAEVFPAVAAATLDHQKRFEELLQRFSHTYSQ